MSQDNLVGRTVAGYKLLSHVGEGGTATVYRAEHPARGQAAIKILRPRMAQDPVAVKRFLREAEFGARIHHEYIVGTYDYGESGALLPRPRVALGEPLGSFLTASGRLPRRSPPGSSSSYVAALAWRTRPASSIAISSPQHHVRPGDAERRACWISALPDAEDNPATGLPRRILVGTLQYGPRGASGELVGEQADVYRPRPHRVPSPHRHPPLPRQEPARTVPASAPRHPSAQRSREGLKVLLAVEGGD